MAQWLSAFTVLAEDTGLDLLPTWWLKTAHKSSFKESDVFFWHAGPPGMHVIHKHTSRQNIHTHFF